MPSVWAISAAVSGAICDEAVGEQDHHLAFGRALAQPVDRCAEPVADCRAVFDDAAFDGAEDIDQRGFVGGQRTLRKAFAGEYHQADPVVRTVHDEIGGHLFRGRDPVGLEIPCQHTAGDVERQHDVDPLGRAAGVFRCALRAGQRHDQQRRRQASQNERQVLQVVFGPVRKPPYAGYGRYPHRSLPLPHPVDVIGDHRQQQQQQP